MWAKGSTPLCLSVARAAAARLELALQVASATDSGITV